MHWLVIAGNGSRRAAPPRDPLLLTGQHALVTGCLDGARHAIMIDSWDAVELLRGAAAHDRRLLGPAFVALSEMKIMWFNIRQCGEGVPVEVS